MRICKFLSCLEDYNLNTLEKVTRDLEKIRELKNRFEFAPEIGLGSKRRWNSDMIDAEGFKFKNIHENIEQLSESFSKSPNWEKFEQELACFSQSYRSKTICSFSTGDPLSLGPKIISSIESNASGELFATAGVSKQISIFEFNNFITDEYKNFSTCPSISINTKSKISCLSWNKSINNRLYSADYDGLINTYDTVMGKLCSSWSEHEKRAWTVDTSAHDSNIIISGSDDYKIKIWDLKQKRSTLTIDLKANVCSVRFSPQNGHLIAAGSADHRIWLFDIRKPSSPIFNAKEHSKSVSYVRFLNGNPGIVSASTDSSLKIWEPKNLNSDIYQVVNSLSGHVNEKNFVGLAVSESNLIANGSEDNQVYIYNQFSKTPVLKHKMTTKCALTGRVMNDEQGTFISSVSWPNRCDSLGNPILMITNSTGHISLISVTEE